MRAHAAVVRAFDFAALPLRPATTHPAHLLRVRDGSWMQESSR